MNLFFRKKSGAATTAPQASGRSTPGTNCPIWHDVARALDQSARPSAGRSKARQGSPK